MKLPRFLLLATVLGACLVSVPVQAVCTSNARRHLLADMASITTPVEEGTQANFDVVMTNGLLTSTDVSGSYVSYTHDDGFTTPCTSKVTESPGAVAKVMIATPAGIVPMPSTGVRSGIPIVDSVSIASTAAQSCGQKVKTSSSAAYFSNFVSYQSQVAKSPPGTLVWDVPTCQVALGWLQKSGGSERCECTCLTGTLKVTSSGQGVECRNLEVSDPLRNNCCAPASCKATV